MKSKLLLVMLAIIMTLSPVIVSAQEDRDYRDDRDNSRRYRQMRNWENRGDRRINQNIRHLNILIIRIRRSNLNYSLKIRLIQQINTRIFLLIQLRERMRDNRFDYDRMYQDYRSIDDHERVVRNYSVSIR